MGTNIYLQRKEPRMVPEYDQVHVAKISYGWKVHFDGSSAANNGWDYDYEADGATRPRIGSMDDLRGYLSSGEWELVDEYGDKRTLEEVLEHDGFLCDGELVNTRISMDDYYDREGYPWSRREFC